MKPIIAVFTLSILIACSSSRKTTPAPGINIAIDTATIKSGDGSSFENAIVINERSESTGVAKEYQWLRENYPGYKFLMQSSKNVKGRQYDILTIKTADGTQKIIYFDISKFYGKL